jgi:hypothetical protein
VPEKPYDLNDAINIPTNAIEVVIKESFTWDGSMEPSDQ